MTPDDRDRLRELAARATRGRRVPDDEWFAWQSKGLIRPGDYGCQTVESDEGGYVMWLTCTPDGRIGHLAVHEPDRYGNHHVITEHEDRTITVGGSIQGRDVPSERIGGVGPIGSRGGWHGWLERGVWRSA
jgi:hypothetical protein